MSDSDNDNAPIVPEPKQKFRRESLFLGVEDAFTFDFGLAGDLPADSKAGGEGIGFGDEEETPNADTTAIMGKEQRPPLTLEEVEAFVKDSDKLSHVITTRPFSNLKGAYYVREAVENHFIDLVETLKRAHDRNVGSSSGLSSSPRQGGKTGRHRPNKADGSDTDDESEKRPHRTRGGRTEGGRGGGRGGTSRGAGGRGRGRGDARGRGRGGQGRGRGVASSPTPPKQ